MQRWLAALAFLATVGCATAPAPISVRVSIAPALAEPEAPAGRLYVLMAKAGAKERTQVSVELMDPNAVYIASVDLDSFPAGTTVALDARARAFPAWFDGAPPGLYEWMAVLDRDLSYSVAGADGGDLRSSVLRADLEAARTKPVELVLDRAIESKAPPESDFVKRARFESSLLTAFWGRPVEMHAAIALPPSYATAPDRKYATVYWVSGYGSTASFCMRRADGVAKAMAAGKIPEMIYVVLDGAIPAGHHAFVDSVNNGPWGRAFVEELIPHIDQNYRSLGAPEARFLTGHSSGGWATLWLIGNYPELFGGTWSTSPDSTDFRNFTGVDVTPGSKDNFFRETNGAPKQLMRMGGKWVWSMEQFTRLEAVLSGVGGPLRTFEWAFSPRGADGQPLPLFDPQTGELRQETLRAWEKFDLRKSWEQRWAVLGPKLRGKLHVWCGAEDNFRLNEAAELLCASLEQLGSDAVCELVPGKDHFTLRPNDFEDPAGLSVRIAREMEARLAR